MRLQHSTFQHLSRPSCLLQSDLLLEVLFFFNTLFFREEGRRDGNISDDRGALISCLLHVPHQELSRNPGMCADREPNCDLLVGTQRLSHQACFSSLAQRSSPHPSVTPTWDLTISLCPTRHGSSCPGGILR
uniref:Uncharacterized protein n=1 Tax=Pipistrellus kuhlii TaxID=59472 RepID=A0A7J7RU25_PIPKU|nr:hypothetical protein mPipKuh1_010243 [Pipistrellus kuhlii]